MERGSWAVVILVAIGAAALVLAWIPSGWPNPVGQDDVGDANRVVPQLVGVADAVDAACRSGDQAQFAEATTAQYRGALSRRLEAVDRQLDKETLLAMAANRIACRAWLAKPVQAMRVKGRHVGLVVQRDRRDGAEVLVFAWDGGQFRLDEMRHAPRVFTAGDASRYLTELLRLR